VDEEIPVARQPATRDEDHAMWKRLLMVICLATGLAAPTMCLAQEAGEAHVGQAVEPAGEAGSEHQLVEFRPSEAIWVIVVFVILLIVLYPTAWKSVLAGLKAREQRIRADLEAAEAQRLKSEATLREYTAQLASAEASVREMLSKAGADAEKIAANIRLHAQQEVEEIKERAAREIESAREQALSEIYSQAADLSTHIAEKILRRSLNADDQRDLVARSLEQLQTLNRG
jgi:F-type H+-transporting ATPase subunit b